MATMDANTKQLPTFSEDAFGKKLDRCGKDAIIKGGGGLILGAIFSVIFFKRRSWPAVLGTGFGLGLAYKGCEQSLNSPK